MVVTSRLLHPNRKERPAVQPRSSSSSTISLLYVIFGSLFVFCAGVIVGTHRFFTTSSPFLTAPQPSARSLASFTGTTDSPLLYTRPAKKITIAYAISWIKCRDKQTSAEGLLDAALVLRHAIHQLHHSTTTTSSSSSFNNNTTSTSSSSSSHYTYHMMAFVHRDAARECQADRLLRETAGYDAVHVVDSPVHASEIHGDHLRNHVDSEWCCGAAEFIKLYMYDSTTTAAPLVVHLDMDVLVLPPRTKNNNNNNMDHVYDAMLYHPDSAIGHTARQQLATEFFPTTTNNLPERIDAMVTRDWPQVIPGRKPGVQAGLMIVKPDRGLLDVILDVIRQGDYVEGFGRDNGWGGRGYGAFVGAQAMQGLMAFVVDALLYDSVVELNQCRHNHIGMDVRYRAAPSFRKNHPKVGQCRNDREDCEDCMVTPIDQVYSIHFNQCRKPWNCIGQGSRELPQDKMAIPEDQVHLDHCLELVQQWHSVRTDLETQLLQQQPMSMSKVRTSQSGNYMVNEFQGHCLSYGPGGYLRLVGGDASTLKQVRALYDGDRKQ